MSLRLGAYLLPGDPVWLRASLSQYYDRLDDLVVPVPEDGLGWMGRPVQVAECLAVIREIDRRGIARIVRARWVDPAAPLSQDTAQRQAALQALSGSVDWVLQLDNDEVLPSVDALVHWIEVAEQRGIPAVSWPMRVLFRRLRGNTFLEVVADDGQPRYEYPGPVAVRSSVTLSSARQVTDEELRLCVVGDDRSLQLRQEARPGEHRVEALSHDEAIVHNSWGRSAASIWGKVNGWGHAEGLKTQAYYAGVWLPAPATWRRLHNFHPMVRPLWPRLKPTTIPPSMLD